jgi:hypothetical protein
MFPQHSGINSSTTHLWVAVESGRVFYQLNPRDAKGDYQTRDLSKQRSQWLEAYRIRE